jgi:RHS repeat-associated protein
LAQSCAAPFFAHVKAGKDARGAGSNGSQLRSTGAACPGAREMKRLAFFLVVVVCLQARAVAASSACPLVPRFSAAPFVFVSRSVRFHAAFAGKGFNGNQTQKVVTKDAKTTTTEFTYTTRDQLRFIAADGATKEELLYDDLGRRIRKNGDYEHWDGRSLVAETDYASGGLLRGYTHGLTLLRENVLGNMVEAYTDGMGSVGALVPENGTAANAGHYRYDAYGNFRTSAHPGDCSADPSGLTCNAPLTYTGHLYDQESNLFYFGARYYDPETGRFLTNDPVAGDALNPPSLHKYLYTYDSPMVYTDPWGEAVGDWWDVRSYADAEAWKNIGHDLWNVASLGTLERVEKQNNLGTWSGVGESVFQGARSISNTASLGLQESIYEAQMEEGPGLRSIGMGISKAAYNLTPMEEIRQLVQEGDQMSTGEKVSAVFMGISKTAGLIAGAKAGGEWGAGKINGVASKPVMQGESGIKPVEEAPQSTNREYISDEVTTQAREARNAPNAAKISTDVPADNYNHGPFTVAEESSAGEAAYDPHSLGAGEVPVDGVAAGNTSAALSGCRKAVLNRQLAMLADDVGYNVSPESWFSKYDTLGRSGTYLTDRQAIADVLGDFKLGPQRLPPITTTALEKALGLEPGSLNNGFRITEVQGISKMNPRSPLTGNRYYLGPGAGLPGGGPEMVVDPIETGRR